MIEPKDLEILNQSSGAWMIWSNEHRAWWKAGGSGYTTNASEAGYFKRGDALAICARALIGSRDIPNEIPVCVLDWGMAGDLYEWDVKAPLPERFGHPNRPDTSRWIEGLKKKAAP